MELAKIEKLLNKYLEGESTLEEENILRVYFSTNTNIAPHLVGYVPLFKYLRDAKNETYTQTIPLKPRKQIYKWISVAALVIFSSSVFTYVNIKNKNDEKAKIAYYKTKEALNLLSIKFNEGAEKVAYLNEFEQTTNSVFKNN